MFVYYYTHIERPFDEVVAQFVGQPADWLPGHLERAYEKAETIRMTLGAGKGFRLTKDVEVSVGNAMTDDSHALLPVSVKATGSASLFPTLEADLEIQSLGLHLVQLTLRGTYRPPLGGAGEALDRMLLHRVAEAAVKTLLEQISEKLEKAAAA